MTRARLTIVATLGLVVFGALAVGLYGTVEAPAPLHALSNWDLFFLAVAAALGDRLELTRHHGRGTTMSIAVVASVALLTNAPPVVLGMAVAAWVAQAVRAMRSERSVRVGSLVAGSLTAWGIGGLAALSAHLDATSWTVGESELLLAPVVTIWVLLLFGAPALEATRGRDPGRACPAQSATATW